MVKAVLKNVTSHPIWFYSGSGTYEMYVLPFLANGLISGPQARWAPGGEEIVHPIYGNVVGIQLPADHDATREIPLNKIYDMSAPGKYTVIFSTRQGNGEVADTERSVPPVTVVSNVLTVTVLPTQTPQ